MIRFAVPDGGRIGAMQAKTIATQARLACVHDRPALKHSEAALKSVGQVNVSEVA